MAGIGQPQTFTTDQSAPWANSQVQFTTNMGRKPPRDPSPNSNAHKGLSILSNLAAQQANNAVDRSKIPSALFGEESVPTETSTMFPYSGRSQDFFAPAASRSSINSMVSGAPPPPPAPSLGGVGIGTSSSRPSRPGIINQAVIAAALGKTGRQLDPVDFPSLGRTPPAPSPIRPNYMNVLHQPTKEEFSIQQEDFPALPGSEDVTGGGSAGGSGPGSTSGKSTGITSTAGGSAALLSNAAAMTSRTASAPTGLLAMAAAAGTTSSAPGAPLRPAASSGMVAAAAETSPPPTGVQLRGGVASGVPKCMVRDQFGVVGLLSQIKSAETLMDQNLHIITNQGFDLTQLGLNLTSTHDLYPTFGSPWAEFCVARPQDMAYPVPSEYLVGVYIRDKLPPPPFEHMSQETLFWLFYNCTQEQMQLLAAKELHKRDWRWIKSERLWVTRSGQGYEKLPNDRGERGVYNYWCVSSWSLRQRQLVIPYDQIDNAPPTFPNLPVPPPASHIHAAQAAAAAAAAAAANSTTNSAGAGGHAISDSGPVH